MKKKFSSKASELFVRTRAAATGVATVALLAANDIAFAIDGEGAIKIVLEVLGGLLIPYGGFRGVTGLIALSDAKSEGDGPATNKAYGQLIAAAMLIALSIALLAKAGDLASLVAS